MLLKHQQWNFSPPTFPIFPRAATWMGSAVSMATTRHNTAEALLNLSSAQWGLRFGDLLWWFWMISPYDFVQSPQICLIYGPCGSLWWFQWFVVVSFGFAHYSSAATCTKQCHHGSLVSSYRQCICSIISPAYLHLPATQVPVFWVQKCQMSGIGVEATSNPNCENWQTVVTIDWMYPRDDSRWALSDTVTGKYIASENVPLGWLLQDQSRWLFPKTVFQNLDMFWNDQLYKFGVLETQWQFRVAWPTPETNEIPFKSEFYHIREKYDMNIKKTTWKNISVLKQQKQSLTGSKFFF